ncbi:MAG: molybdopterin molybdotransferase MoeA [Gammaproteobacteria bacterium]
MSGAILNRTEHEPLISVEQATRRIIKSVAPVTTESISLDHAHGRILREQIFADRDQPAFNRATMDGIAINHSAITKGTTKFYLQDKQSPGQAPKILSDEHCAIAITTGAPLPEGCTAVVPQEKLTFHGAAVFLHKVSEVHEYSNVHLSGSDFRKGELLLTPGCTIGAGEVGAIASAGRRSANVSAVVRVAVVITGNEIELQSESSNSFQIRDINGPIVTSVLSTIQGCEVSRVYVLDSIAALEKVIGEQLANNDVVITTGGVSKGDADFIPHVMERLDVQQLFHGVAQKPGKPLWVGLGPQGLVFGLPGNPVSVTHCLVRYVLPAIRRMQQATDTPPKYARLARDMRGLKNKIWFVPTFIETDEEAVVWADPRVPNTSGDFSSLVNTGGFIELPMGTSPIKQGTPLKLYEFGRLL